MDVECLQEDRAVLRELHQEPSLGALASIKPRANWEVAPGRFWAVLERKRPRERRAVFVELKRDTTYTAKGFAQGQVKRHRRLPVEAAGLRVQVPVAWLAPVEAWAGIDAWWIVLLELEGMAWRCRSCCWVEAVGGAMELASLRVCVCGRSRKTAALRSKFNAGNRRQSRRNGTFRVFSSVREKSQLTNVQTLDLRNKLYTWYLVHLPMYPNCCEHVDIKMNVKCFPNSRIK